MKNNTLSQEGYNKLNRLVDILNEKFKDKANTKMDYYEAKDAITKYNSTLKTYKIQGVDLSNIDKADAKEIEEKIKKLEDILNSNLTLKGEFVIVVEGNTQKVEMPDIKELLIERINNGQKKSQAVKEIAQEYNISKNVVYKESLNIDAWF